MADLSVAYDVGDDNYLDLVFVNGDLVLTSDVNPAGTHVIRQRVQQAVRAFLGEWFLAMNEGVPYFQTLLQKGSTRADRESILRDVITAVPGINTVTQLSSTTVPKLRTFSLTYSATTTAGKVQDNLNVQYAGGVYP